MGATGSGLALGSAGLGNFGTGQVRAAETVIENFNRSSPLADYNGETSGADYQIVQDSMEEGTSSSTNTLKATGDYGDIGSTNVSTPRGNEYRVRIKVGDSSTGPSLLTCVQDTTAAIDGCYWAYVNQKGGKLDLNLRENGSHTDLASASMSSLSQGTIYELAIELDSDTVRAILYESDGTTVVTDTGSVSDSTHSGGQLGFYTGGGSYPAYYDYVTKESIGSDGGSSSTTSFVIDDFEDGNLSEYEHDTTRSGRASIVSSPTYKGSYAFMIRDEPTEVISTSGLDAYPSAGDTFSYWVRGSGGADMTNFRYGVQNHSNGYFVRVNIAEDRLKLYSLETGDATLLDGQTSGFTLNQNMWYRTEVTWETDGTQTVTLYNTDGTQLAQVSGSDTKWNSGGIGLDAYPSSGQSVYFDYMAVSEATQLGSFENGLDGWTTTGSNSLSRVDGNQQPAAITEGSYALDATVDSDSEPSIENQQLVQNADFENNPCLLADVLPTSVKNSDSAVTFRFRYHHSDPGGVEESHEMTVRQQYGCQICWDMSNLSATKLANPDRLEVVWYPEEHPPSSGFDYDGRVIIDNIHLSDNQNDVTNARKCHKQRELE